MCESPPLGRGCLPLTEPPTARGRSNPRRIGAIGDTCPSGYSLQLFDAEEPAIFVSISALRKAPRASERWPRLLLYWRVAKRRHSGDRFSSGEFTLVFVFEMTMVWLLVFLSVRLSLHYLVGLLVVCQSDEIKTHPSQTVFGEATKYYV